MIQDYEQYDATGLAQLIASGEVSAAEALATALAKIDAGEPKYNAIAVDMRARAKAQIERPLSGPFAGVPFLVKDIYQDIAGEISTMGAVSLRDRRASHTSIIVDRFMAAGLVIVGSTTTPELGLRATTETILHGATRNPWAVDRTPGGSSGGAAAAVAARYVPMAGASDGGGSIRIPAAYNGLFGLKPSRGRVPEGAHHGELWEGCVVSHALTRSVRDSAALLDAIAGPEIGGPFNIAPPARPYIQEVGADPGRYRIGFSTRSPVGGQVDPEMIDALHKSAKLLESLGHHVEEAEPAIDGNALARCYMSLYFGHVAAAVSHICKLTGRKEAEFHTDTRALALLGRALSAGDYVQMHGQWNDFTRALGKFHQSYDFFMTPVTAMGPSLIGELDTPKSQENLAKLMIALNAGKILLKSGIIDQLAGKSFERTPFTQLSNMSFTPSMSVPLAWSAANIPIGIQFVAKFGAEDQLIRLASQLEQAQPWITRQPV
jgi:amidase